MDEVFCSKCNRHIGWMNYAGPCGSFYCDECKEILDTEDASEGSEG